MVGKQLSKALIFVKKSESKEYTWRKNEKIPSIFDGQRRIMIAMIKKYINVTGGLLY
jgi:hypothetical protein